MKNAMKKLMAFALVAVMLIGMLPFAASAATTVTVNIGSELIVCSVSDGVINPNDISKVGNAIAGKNPAIVGWTYRGINYNRLGEIRIADTDTVGIDPVWGETVCDGTWSCPATTHDADCKKALCPNGCGVYASPSESHAFTCPNYRCGCNGTAGYAEGPDHHPTNCTKYRCANCNLPLGSTNHWGKCEHATVADKCPTPGCNASATASAETHATNCPSYKAPATQNPPAEDNTQNPPTQNPPADDNTQNPPADNNTQNPPADDNNDVVEYAEVIIYVGNSNAGTTYLYKNPVSVAKVVDRFDLDDADKHYAFDYYTIDGDAEKEYDDTDVVVPGQTARIYVKVTESKLNHNKVYLQIFMNNDFDVPAKTINVTTMATENGLYREGNVKDLILDSFSAKNSTGIKIDGMYPSTGSWVAKFLEDTKVKNVSSDEIIEMKEDDYVVFNIMVTNAKLASSSTADSSNYKTGDQIFAPIAIMAVSACALAAVAFFLNKKRAM